jgi:hypothetical protein
MLDFFSCKYPCLEKAFIKVICRICMAKDHQFISFANWYLNNSNPHSIRSATSVP